MNCKKIAIRALVALLCATMLIGMIPLYVSAAEEILVTIGTATVDKATATVTNIADGEYAGDYYIVDIPVTVTQNTTKGFYIGKFDMDVPGTDIIYHSVDMTGAIFRKAQFKGAKTTADASTPKGLVAMFVMDGDNENHTETGLVATMKYMVPVAKEVGEYPVEIVGDPEFVAYDESVSAFTPTTVTNGKIIVTDSSAKTEPKIFTPDTFNFSTGTSLAFAKNTEDATYDFMRVSGNGTGADGSRFVFPTDVEISKLPVMRVVYKANTAGTLSMDVHYTGIPTLTKRMWGFGTAFDASETWTNLYYDFSANRPTGGEDGDAKVVADFDWSKVQKLTKCELRPFGNKGDITGKTLDIAYIGFFADKASAEAYEFASKTPAVVTPVAMYDKDKLNIYSGGSNIEDGTYPYLSKPVYDDTSKTWKMSAPGEKNTADDFGFDIKVNDLPLNTAKYAKFGIKLSGSKFVDSDNINCGVKYTKDGEEKHGRFWGHGTAMSSAKDIYKELILDINGTDGYKDGGDGNLNFADAISSPDTTISFLRFKPFGTNKTEKVTDAGVEFTYIAFFSTLEDATNYVYVPSEDAPKTYTVTFVADGAEFEKYEDVVEGTALVYPTTTPTKEGYTFKGWDVAAGTEITSDLTVTAQFEENTPSAEPVALIPANKFKSVAGSAGWVAASAITTTADGKSYWHFTTDTAAGYPAEGGNDWGKGAYTGDHTRIYTYFNASDFPEGFKLTDTKFVKIGYRGTVANATANLDINPMPYNEGKNTRLWGGAKPAQTLDGKWNSLVLDVSTFTDGEYLAAAKDSGNFFAGNCSGIMNGLCFKPQGATGKELKADDTYDVLYVAFFATKEAADAYVYADVPADDPAVTFTVTFTADGKEFAKLTDVAKDTLLTYPATNPTKDGYTFKGWDVAEGTKITSNLTVNAIFEEIKAVTPVAMYDQDKLSFKKVNYFDNITYSEASKSWTLTAPGTQTTEDNFGFDVNFTDLLFKDAKYAKFGIKLTNGNPVDSDNINCAVTIPNKGVSEKRLWGHGTAMSSAKDTYKELILDINGTNGYTGGDGITGADANADATTTINFLRFKPFGTAGASVTDATVEFTYIAFFSTLEDAEAYVYAPSVSVEYVTVTFMADGKVFYTNDKQVKGEAIVYPTTEPTKDGYTFEGWDVAAGTVITENTTVNAKFVETPVDTGSVVFNAKEFTYSTNGGNIKVAEGKDGKYIYAHFTAAADGKSADATKAQIKFDESAYPKGFTLLNNKFMKLAYRSNVASSSKMDFNPNPVKISNRMWGPKPDMTYDGNWQTLTVDLSTLGWTGGEGFVKGANADEIYKNNFDGIMAGLCLKPYQGNGLDMKADEYFDVLYVGFFDTKEAADAYTFAGFATITIKVEGADDVVLDVVDGDKVTLPAAPEKAGYRFTGWSDGKGKLYGAGQVIEATDLVLTAQFEAATEYYVTYYDEDETTVLGKVTVPADNAKYKHITAPTKDGYKFIGWTIKGTSTIVYSGDSFVGDKELVANYKEGSTNDLSTLINVLKIIKIKKSEGDTKPSGTTESKVLDAKLYTAAQLAEVYQANENFASAGLKTINGVEYAAYTAKQGTYGDDGLNLIFKLEDIADGQKFVDYPVIKFGYYSTASVDAVEPNVIASYQGQDQRTWGASAGTVNGKFAEIVYNYSTALIGNNAGGSYSFSNFDADGTVISPCFKAWGSQTLTVSGNDETFALAYIAFFKNEADAKSYEFGKTVIGEATETPAEETPAEEKPAEETKPAKGAVATYTAAQILTVSSVDVNITMDKEAVSADGTSYAKFSATADGASGDNTKFIIATADLGADFNIKDYPYLAVSYKSNIGVDTTIDFNMRTSYQGSVLRIWGARIDFQRNDKKNTMVIDLANAFNGGEGAAGKDYAWANVDANGICNALWFKPWGGSGGKEMKSGEYFMIEKLAFFADKASAEAFN